MAKKTVKDILKLLDGVIKSNELSTALGASDLGAVELTEDGFKEIKEQTEELMTMESALHNSELEEKILNEKKAHITNQAYFAAEKKIHETIAPKLAIEFSKEAKLHDMLEKIGESIEGKLSNTADADALKLIEDLKKERETLNKEILSVKEENENQITELKTGFEQDRIKTQFLLKAKSINWAEPYKDETVNKALINTVWDEATQSAIFKNVDGKLVPFQKDNPEKSLIIKNKPATFEDVVDPLFEKFIKKSEPVLTGGGRIKEPDFKDYTPAERERYEMDRAQQLQTG